MKKNIFYMVLLILGGSMMAQNKKVITQSGEKVLESPVMTTAERDALASPYIGYLIYNTTTGCHEFFNGVKGWYNYCWRGYQKTDQTSGGTAVISSIDCASSTPAGNMGVDIPVSGVKQIFNVNVSTVGTYNIRTTTTYGVTFSGSGTFANTGTQTIELNASGIPSASGTAVFALNIIPTCGFSRTIDMAISPSTNGTGVVSSYSCSTASAGAMAIDVPVSNVTQTITATVVSLGSYNISTTKNGVTFVGSGTFASTGPQVITLYASGTPTVSGNISFVLNTNPDCSFNRAVSLATPSVVGAAGRTWMDRNLGATQVATSMSDYNAYGSLYQWGRGSDGHELINWSSGTAGVPVNGTTGTLSSNNQPGHNLFIVINGDWKNPANNALWDGLNGTNNPCPAGYRVPTYTELITELNASGVTNTSKAYASPLKLPSAGYRNYGSGGLEETSTYVAIWTAGLGKSSIRLSPSSIYGNGFPAYLALGASVRCIKD